MDRFLGLCRPGFEGDLAAELTVALAEEGVGGYARTQAGEGVVEWVAYGVSGRELLALRGAPSLQNLVFCRQLSVTGPCLENLDPTDRASGLAGGAPWPVADVLVETPPGPAFAGLERLSKRLAGPVRGALERAGRLAGPRDQKLRLHITLTSGTAAWVGYAPVSLSLEEPGGVRRLRRLAGAPSRSGVKLQEAFLAFLTPTERHLTFAGRPRAVDLGAAPGGWTFVLRSLGAEVFAVDHGALAPELADDPLVIHVRADAFTYEPPVPVDWLCCDVVDKPARVVETLARWLRRRWAARAIFNLKLPMKQRHAAVVDARARFFRTLGPRAEEYTFSVKQLYHDREEVTCYAAPRGAAGPAGARHG
jgi:23S rRNA (cytidine2498-2'-O)-methyltransferase